MASAIKTVVRLRPFLPSQVKQGYENTRMKVIAQKREVVVREDTTKSFKFDNVFDGSRTQEQVYTACELDGMVDKALLGYHSTIFAYGQTGSGKTFTMQGTEDSHELSGIIPKLVKTLFKRIQHPESRTYIISMSFLQIYNQRIYDLLNPASLNNRNVTAGNIEGLRLRWTKDQQFTVENLFLFECKTQDQLLKYFLAGSKNRINASHKLNVQSSRSHSIMTIKIQSFLHSNPSHVLTSKIQLVDLAGSQRIGVTGAEGRAVKESIDINKSLFTLRQVISVLADKKQDKQYAPYRDSKLTSLLKQSVGGNSFSLMIACLCPNDAFIDQNISTLTYATKTSHIHNRPVINDDPRTKIVNDLRMQVRQLNSQLEKANKHIQIISALPHNSPQNIQTPRKEKVWQTDKQAMDRHHLQSQLPIPLFKKNVSQGSYENMSERLIQSINMVRELLRSNKELREKIQLTSNLVDEKDVQIYELSRENEKLRDRTKGGIGGVNNASQRQFGKQVVGQGRRSVKESKFPPAVFEHPLQGTNFGLKPTLPHGYSVDISRMLLGDKGADSAPTNYNKREVATSQEQRLVYSRGDPQRHAITAKITKRGWLGRQSEPRRFLSFYDDPRTDPPA